jgi:hypothetical protein
MNRTIRSKSEQDSLEAGKAPLGTLNQTFQSFKLCQRDGLNGFEFQPGDGFISSKEVTKMIDEGCVYVKLGQEMTVPMTQILQAVLDCLRHIFPPISTKIKTKKFNIFRKPPNAYMQFNSFYRKIITAAMPEYHQGEISKLIGAMWRASPIDTKKEYVLQAERQKNISKRISARWPHRPCSKEKKKRMGCFVNSGYTGLSKADHPIIKEDLADFFGLQCEANIEEHIARSVKNVSCDAIADVSLPATCTSLLSTVDNKNDFSCDIFSWIDSWEAEQQFDLWCNLVDWCRTTSDLTVIMGDIQLQSCLLSDQKIDNDTKDMQGFEPQFVSSNVWVPHIDMENEFVSPVESCTRDCSASISRL